VPGGWFNPVQRGGEVRVNDVAYVGLDPSGRLPPLFLGIRKKAAAA
jgi:hypothetical protein